MKIIKIECAIKNESMRLECFPLCLHKEGADILNFGNRKVVTMIFWNWRLLLFEAITFLCYWTSGARSFFDHWKGWGQRHFGFFYSEGKGNYFIKVDCHIFWDIPPPLKTWPRCPMNSPPYNFIKKKEEKQVKKWQMTT